MEKKVLVIIGYLVWFAFFAAISLFTGLMSLLYKNNDPWYNEMTIILLGILLIFLGISLIYIISKIVKRAMAKKHFLLLKVVSVFFMVGILLYSFQLVYALVRFGIGNSMHFANVILFPISSLVWLSVLFIFNLDAIKKLVTK